MRGAQVVADQGERVAVHFEAAALAFFSDVGPHRVVHEAFLFDEVVDDGAFSRTEGACYSYYDHGLDVFKSRDSRRLLIYLLLCKSRDSRRLLIDVSSLRD